MRLSVLDQSPIPAGANAADALANTIALAQLTERLGYTRYWLAEHHNTKGLAGSAPEGLTPRVASATTTIRVGAGGVMLPHYSPLKGAQAFHVLETPFPRRIDPGIGPAPRGDPPPPPALRAGPEPPSPPQLQDLIGSLEDRLAPRPPFASVRATPVPPGDSTPPIWLLGSSDYSAACAA